MATGGGTSAVVKITGDNKPLAKSLTESKAMLTAFQTTTNTAGAANQAYTAFSAKNVAIGQSATVAADAIGNLGLAMVGTVAVGAAAVAALAGVAFAMIKGADAAQDFERATIRLNTVLANTGNKTGFASTELIKLAQDFAKEAHISTTEMLGAVQELAEAGNIHGQNAKNFLKDASDYAAHYAVSVTEASKAIRAAYENPSAAHGFLVRGADKERLQQLVDAGRIADAQKFLHEHAVFSGAREALGGTPQGRLDSAWADLNNALTEFGAKLLPLVNALTDVFTGLIEVAAMLVKGLTELWDIIEVITLKGPVDRLFESIFNRYPGETPEAAKKRHEGGNEIPAGKTSPYEMRTGGIVGTFESLEQFYTRLATGAAQTLGAEPAQEGTAAAHKQTADEQLSTAKQQLEVGKKQQELLEQQLDAINKKLAPRGAFG